MSNGKNTIAISNLQIKLHNCVPFHRANNFMKTYDKNTPIDFKIVKPAQTERRVICNRIEI